MRGQDRSVRQADGDAEVVAPFCGGAGSAATRKRDQTVGEKAQQHIVLRCVVHRGIAVARSIRICGKACAALLDRLARSPGGEAAMSLTVVTKGEVPSSRGHGKAPRCPIRRLAVMSAWITISDARMRSAIWPPIRLTTVSGQNSCRHHVRREHVAAGTHGFDDGRMVRVRLDLAAQPLTRISMLRSNTPALRPCVTSSN